MTDGVAQSSRQGQVQVYFTTSSAEVELELPEEKRQLLVPTSRISPGQDSARLLISMPLQMFEDMAFPRSSTPSLC